MGCRVTPHLPVTPAAGYLGRGRLGYLGFFSSCASLSMSQRVVMSSKFSPNFSACIRSRSRSDFFMTEVKRTSGSGSACSVTRFAFDMKADGSDTACMGTRIDGGNTVDKSNTEPTINPVRYNDTKTLPSTKHMDDLFNFDEGEMTPPEGARSFSVKLDAKTAAALLTIQEHHSYHPTPQQVISGAVRRWFEDKKVQKWLKSEMPNGLGTVQEQFNDTKIPPASGYVYLIRGADGFYKIGKSWDPKSRFSAIQNASPIPLKFVFAIAVADMKVAERAAHQMFKHCRANGEWFRLTRDEVRQFKAMTNSTLCPSEPQHG